MKKTLFSKYIFVVYNICKTIIVGGFLFLFISFSLLSRFQKTFPSFSNDFFTLKTNDNNQSLITFKDIFDTPYGKWLIEKAWEYFKIPEIKVRSYTPKQLKKLDKRIQKYENDHTIITVPNPQKKPRIFDPFLPLVPMPPFYWKNFPFPHNLDNLPPINGKQPNSPKQPNIPPHNPKHPKKPNNPNNPSVPNPSHASSKLWWIILASLGAPSLFAVAFFLLKKRKTKLKF